VRLYSDQLLRGLTSLFLLVQLSDLGNNGIQLGFAAFGTDTGHNGTTNDGTWALGNPVRSSFLHSSPYLMFLQEKLIDFGWRAMHLSVLTAKTVVAEYYGQAANKSYYLSCSTGGRQGYAPSKSYSREMLTAFFADSRRYRCSRKTLTASSSDRPLTGSEYVLPPFLTCSESVWKERTCSHGVSACRPT
jgi:hypothetical protein